MASYQMKPAVRLSATRVVLATAIALMTTAIGSARQAPGAGNVSPAQLFQQATHQQDAAGNLEAAVALYTRVLAAKPDRALAAKAQLQLALCLEKLGKPEARGALETLVRDYADQRDVAAYARDRMAATATARSSDDHGFVAREIWTGDSLTEHVIPKDASATIGFRVKPSSDGQWLAFADAASFNVAIRNVTTGEIRLVTRDARPASVVGWDEAEGAMHPFVSPDGSQVAYQWFSHDKLSLRVVPVGGGRPRVVASLGDLYVGAIRWSPDGRTLALIAARWGDVHIALMSLSDGTMTRVKALPWRTDYTFGTDMGGVSLGGFSPDGRWLLYSVEGARPGDGDAIFAIAVDGSQQTTLIHGPSTNQSPAWTPDGRAVVFVSDRGTDFGLWSIAVANGKPASAPELLRANVGHIQGLGFSRNGSLFYGRMNLRDDVLAVDLDPATGALTSQPAPLIDRSMGSNRGARWSPDQRRLAFVRSTPSGDTVVVRSVDGAERTLPTTFRSGPYGFAAPTWFPDGRSLLIPDIDRTVRRKTVRRVQLDTLEETVVLDGPNWEMRGVTGPSPDGKSVYYSKAPESPAGDGRELVRLVRRDLESGHETELYRAEFTSPPASFSPAISPDGERLAFVLMTEARVRTLMTLTTAGGSPKPVATGDWLPLGENQSLVWTRDGRFILVASEQTHGVRRVWAVPADGGAPRQLDVAMPGLRLADVSPDGRRLAFVVTRTSPELGVFDNVLKPAAAAK